VWDAPALCETAAFRNGGGFIVTIAGTHQLAIVETFPNAQTVCRKQEPERAATPVS
jgi:hypothetical protein